MPYPAAAWIEGRGLRQGHQGLARLLGTLAQRPALDYKVVHDVGAQRIARGLQLVGDVAEQRENAVPVGLQGLFEGARARLRRWQVQRDEADRSTQGDIDHTPRRLLPGDLAQGEHEEN